MPYTAPATVVTGTTITTAWGNSVKAATDFLANPPSCRVYNNTTQSIPNNALTALTFNAERWDTDTMHSTSTNTGRITITTAGLYVVSFNWGVAAGADYQHVAGLILLDGATYIAHSNHGSVIEATLGPTVSVTTVYKLNAAQFLEAVAFQKNAAATARNSQSVGNYVPEFTATWIGTG